MATLARFGEGKLKGDELIARATTPIQKYEALFYAAMDHRAAGDTKGGDELLRQVVAGTGLELSEVALARDMLDPGQVAGRRPAPSGRGDSLTVAPPHPPGHRLGRARAAAPARASGGRGRLRRRAPQHKRGAGVEFGGYREYVPGDDLRWLDRRSLLRHERLVVRQFETETDRALCLLVDASASMGFRGPGAPGAKLAFAASSAAALARVALASGDPVSLDVPRRGSARGARAAVGRARAVRAHRRRARGRRAGRRRHASTRRCSTARCRRSRGPRAAAPSSSS